MSSDAKNIYEKWYRKMRTDNSLGPQVSGLLDRSAPVLRRLSMIFAITDQTMVIEACHMNAAIAWINYWRESVRFIFQTAQAEHIAETTNDTAKKIIEYLTTHGKKTKTDITRECFGGNSSAALIDAALEELLTSTPPEIEVETAEKKKGAKGKAAKFYKHLTNSTNLTKHVVNQWVSSDLDPLRNIRTVRTKEGATNATDDEFVNVSSIRTDENNPETLTDQQDSLNSFSSLTDIEKPSPTTHEGEAF
jgi:putative DNA primase/helicase